MDDQASGAWAHAEPPIAYAARSLRDPPPPWLLTYLQRMSADAYVLELAAEFALRRREVVKKLTTLEKAIDTVTEALGQRNWLRLYLDRATDRPMFLPPNLEDGLRVIRGHAGWAKQRIPNGAGCRTAMPGNPNERPTGLLLIARAVLSACDYLSPRPSQTAEADACELLWQAVSARATPSDEPVARWKPHRKRALALPTTHAPGQSTTVTDDPTQLPKSDLGRYTNAMALAMSGRFTESNSPKIAGLRS